MSATTIYRLLFERPCRMRRRLSFLTNEEALVKLTGDKSIDVAVVVVGQPAKLLVDMKPEARAADQAAEVRSASIPPARQR